MASNKLPNKKTDEELLKALEPQSIEDLRSPQKAMVSPDDVMAFIHFFNLEPGLQLIKDKALYDLYCKYSQEPVSPQTFNTRMVKYFDKTRTRSGFFYYINQNHINLDQKGLEFLNKKSRRDKTKSSDWHRHFQNFLEKYNITPGKDKFIWVSNYVLYDLYDEWTYEIKKKAVLPETEFKRFCSIHFEHKKETMEKMWFKLDESITQILTPQRIAALQARKSFKHGTAKKEKPKKQHKVSGSKT